MARVLLAHQSAPFENSAWMLLRSKTCLKSEIFSSLMNTESCGWISESSIGSRMNTLAVSAARDNEKTFTFYIFCCRRSGLKLTQSKDFGLVIIFILVIVAFSVFVFLGAIDVHRLSVSRSLPLEVVRLRSVLRDRGRNFLASH